MPNVVKGSRQEKMVVVPHRPVRRVSMTLIFALLLVAGVFGGRWYGAVEAGRASGEVGSLRQLASRLEQENSRLKQQLATLERASVMDRQANSEIQTTLTELREYITKLEQDVQFYRQAMASEFADVGLIVGQMDLQSTPDPLQVRYKLVMRQEESDGDYLMGHVNVDVVGLREGQKVSLPLKDLSKEQEQVDIRLRFRYFQNIEGVMELPADFEPQQVVINAVATAPMAKTIDRTFSWVVEGE